MRGSGETCKAKRRSSAVSGCPSDQRRFGRSRQVTSSFPSAKNRKASLLIDGTCSTSTATRLSSSSVRVVPQKAPRLANPPIAVGNWFASRNRIGQVHFRNVNTRVPRLDYTEVWPDEGDNDMYEVMKLLVKNNYKRMIMPEHPRGIDADRQLGNAWGQYVGWTHDVAYARAMLQIALRQVRGL